MTKKELRDLLEREFYSSPPLQIGFKDSIIIYLTAYSLPLQMLVCIYGKCSIMLHREGKTTVYWHVFTT